MSAAARALALALALGAAAAAVGCCASPTYALRAYEVRFDLTQQPRYALLGTSLEREDAWLFGEPAAVVSAHAAHYYPRGARAPEEAPAAPLDAAPPRLVEALRAVDAALQAKGYRRAEAGASGASGEPGPWVVQVGITGATGDGPGGLQRVSLSAGGELDGRFAPYRIAFEARVAADDPCPVTAAGLAGDLAAALPEWAPPEER